MADKKDQSFQMRVDQPFLDQLDEWRRKQSDIPSRAEAIRRLVALALKSEKALASNEKSS